MFVQISPLETDVSETLSSLNFASRVRGVELGPAKKQVDMSELQKLKLLVSFDVVMWLYTILIVNLPSSFFLTQSVCK